MNDSKHSPLGPVKCLIFVWAFLSPLLLNNLFIKFATYIGFVVTLASLMSSRSGLLIFNYIWVRRQLMEVYNLLQCIGMFASLIHTCCWIVHKLRYQYVVQRVIKPFGRHSKPFLLKDFEQWWNEKPQFHAAFFIRMYMYCVSCKWWQMVLAIVWI